MEVLLPRYIKVPIGTFMYLGSSTYLMHVILECIHVTHTYILFCIQHITHIHILFFVILVYIIILSLSEIHIITKGENPYIIKEP